MIFTQWLLTLNRARFHLDTPGPAYNVMHACSLILIVAPGFVPAGMREKIGCENNKFS